MLLGTNSSEGSRGGPGVLVLYQTLAAGGPRGLVLHQTLVVGVVLEAWCYTRAAGTEVIHVATTGFQGIPDCVARYKFPQNVAATGSIPTAARGVDIQRALSSIPG